MTTLDAFTKTLPILLIILLGVWLRASRFLRPETVSEIKKLIVGLTLPLLLFRAFANMQFEARYLAIVAAVFLLNTLILFGAARLARRSARISPYLPALLTGFEAGMMGYAIFGAIYGQDSLQRFAVMDLGQVLFVYFIMVPTLDHSGGPKTAGGLLLGFLRSPVIAGILAGMVLNLTGLYRLLGGWPLSAALLETVALVGGLTTPLVALVLGYELRFQPGRMSRPLLTALVRLGLWVALGFLLNTFLLGGLLGLDTLYQAALMTMFILPAPFIIPLFARGASQEENDDIVNTLSISTVLTLFAVIAIRLIYVP